MPELPGHRALPARAAAAAARPAPSPASGSRRRSWSAPPTRRSTPWPAARVTALRRRRQAHRHRRRRHRDGRAPDDCRTASLVAGRVGPSRDAIGLAALDVATGTLVLTEAGSTRRASLHMARGAAGIAALDPGGLEPLAADLPAFARATGVGAPHPQARAHRPVAVQRNRQRLLRRDPPSRRLSPMRMSDALSGERARRGCSRRRERRWSEWRDALIAETGDGFPERVTAFRPGMRVHGRFGQPCPVCGTPVQRIRYAANEANYCPTCQTERPPARRSRAVTAAEGRLAAHRSKNSSAASANGADHARCGPRRSGYRAARQAFGSCGARTSRPTSKPARLARASAWASDDSSRATVRDVDRQPLLVVPADEEPRQPSSWPRTQKSLQTIRQPAEDRRREPRPPRGRRRPARAAGRRGPRPRSPCGSRSAASASPSDARRDAQRRVGGAAGLAPIRRRRRAGTRCRRTLERGDRPRRPAARRRCPRAATRPPRPWRPAAARTGVQPFNAHLQRARPPAPGAGRLVGHQSRSPASRRSHT